jgi:hypothetical protein
MRLGEGRWPGEEWSERNGIGYDSSGEVVQFS